MSQMPLFDSPELQPLAAGAVLLHGFVADADTLAEGVRTVTAQAPWRHGVTPGGRRMSVAMTNCGEVGWVSDARGYRYEEVDPLTGCRWPAMPPRFLALAQGAAARAGCERFTPDACLINCYEAGAKLSLHQDRDERDLGAPIVSVSLGLPAVFLFGGLQRGEQPRRIPLQHGDVVVWGGASRLAFHGIAPLAAGWHPFWGDRRINLTFRQARWARRPPFLARLKSVPCQTQGEHLGSQTADRHL